MIGLALLAPAAAGEAGSSSTTLRSPLERHTVQLERLEHRRFGADEHFRDLDSVDHVRWRLTIRWADDATVAARADFADVYDWGPDARPATSETIFRRLTLSPEEQFVVLPAEGWGHAPGTNERVALALDPELEWDRAPLVLDGLAWADALVAVGQRDSDCDFAVDLFDGSTGRQRALLPSDSPEGHRIERIVGRRILVRRILDNCAPEEQRRAWVARCRGIDLDTLGVTEVACPDEGDNG